jgi:hypothetical protein
MSSGFVVVEDVVSKEVTQLIQEDLVSLCSQFGFDFDPSDVHSAWNSLSKKNRDEASAVYNGFKFLPSLQLLTQLSVWRNLLYGICEIEQPALVDVNCRIDDWQGDRYLFDWHQDYWFSKSSKKAVVVWIPVVDMSEGMGGIELVSQPLEGLRVFKAKRGDKYDSYADGAVLDEELPNWPRKKIERLKAGDAAVFSFLTLHRSLPVSDPSRARFTVQLRFADFAEREFKENRYKPTTVTKQTTEYLRGK